MGKIDIPDGNTTLFFEPEEILCMKAAGQYTYIYVQGPAAEKEYREIYASYCLKRFEEKVKDFSFMRVCDNAVVNLKQVFSLSKNNIIHLRTNCCGGIPLKPALRKTFLEKMKLLTVLLIQPTDWLQDLLGLVC